MKDPRWTRESDWLVGFVFGAGLIFVLCLSLDAATRHNSVENWGVLVASFATVLAGAIGGFLAFRSSQNQISAAHHRSEEMRKLRLRASISMLPALLAELSRRCEHNAFTVLLNSRGAMSDENLPEHLKKYLNAEIQPFFEGQDIVLFRDCIEYAEEDDAEILQHIVRNFQVFYSRCHSYDFPEVTFDRQNRVVDPTTFFRALDWNRLHLLMEHCLTFARSEQKNIPQEFEANRLRKSFCSSRLDSFTTNPKILSIYESFAKDDAEKIVADLVSSQGQLDLETLIQHGIL